MAAHPPRKTLFILAIVAGVLITSFQNFGTVPVEALKLSMKPAQARALSMTDGSTDIRDLAPVRPLGELEKPVIAVPESGSNLSSVGGDWVKRQARMLTEGAEQRFLEDANRWIGQGFNNMVSETPPPKSAAGREPARFDSTGTAAGPHEEESVLTPTHLKFTQVNKVEVGFQGQTKLSCMVKGESMELNLSRPVVDALNLQLKHDTQSATSTVQFNYSW